MTDRGRSSGRAGWAALAGVAIGAALLAGVDEPPRPVSATRPSGQQVVKVDPAVVRALHSARGTRAERFR